MKGTTKAKVVAELHAASKGVFAAQKQLARRFKALKVTDESELRRLLSALELAGENVAEFAEKLEQGETPVFGVRYLKVEVEAEQQSEPETRTIKVQTIAEPSLHERRAKVLTDQAERTQKANAVRRAEFTKTPVNPIRKPPRA